jgi:acetoin utilization deacetylase AcuC-like enzyme
MKRHLIHPVTGSGGLCVKIVYSKTHLLHAPQREMDGETSTFYPHHEIPQRAERILEVLRTDDVGEVIPPREYDPGILAETHDSGLIEFYRKVIPAWVARTGRPEPIVPDLFALRRLSEKPADPACQVGYYCFDPQTPIMEHTWEAVLSSAWCALTAADLLLEGEDTVYALCRPPGHHAGRDYYGGYCYLNNAALAASKLRRRGRPAILDIDYHHGNGTQDIFYDSAEVLYVSLHADPNFAFPCFSGYRNERGEGAGKGCNANFPLPLDTDEAGYHAALDMALDEIHSFAANFLIVSLGVDTVQEDPLGGLKLSIEDFRRIGGKVAKLGLPVLVAQEGGYNLSVAGRCVANLLGGITAEGIS